MKILNSLNKQINLKPVAETALMIGAAVTVLSPISIFSTFSRINQIALKTVLFGNFLNTRKPHNPIAKAITVFNPIALPYFIGLGLWSAATDPNGLQTLIPRTVENAKWLADKLPTQEQIWAMAETVRSKLPSQEQISETLGLIKEKIPAEINKTAFVNFYKENVEGNQLVLGSAAISIAALITIGSIYAYRCCGQRKVEK